LIAFFFAGPYLYLFLKLLFDKKTKYKKKIVYILILILMFYPSMLLTNFGFSYLGKVQGAIQYDLVNIYSLVTDYMQSSKTFYDTTNLGIPADTFFLKRYLYFLYMPLTITQEPASMYFSLENLFFLFVTIIIIKKFKFNLKEINALTLSYYLSILVLFLFIPIIFSNYGIALRYKWLIIPYFLLAFLDLRKKIK